MRNFITCNSATTNRMIMSRRMRWAGHIASIWEKRNVYSVLVGQPEETIRKT
jgi:hypothetical protein